MEGLGFTDPRAERVVREALDGKFSYINTPLQQARMARGELASGSQSNGDLNARMLDNYDIAIQATIDTQSLEAALPLIKEAYGADNAMAAALMILEHPYTPPTI